MAQILIGVSGWQYPDFEKRFYPKSLAKVDQLAFYAREFPTVEINNTFYQLPRPSTVKNWRESVPVDFRFSVKASRYITHMKNLLEPEKTLHEFFSRIEILEEKCGPVLFQLPPNWQVNASRLETFLNHLPQGYRFAFEFRNQTWFADRIYTLLRKQGIAFCIYDFNFRQSPLLTTTDFVYIRLHGPGRAYHDPYDMDALELWANRIERWVSAGQEVYCYFDNTYRGYAWKNAKTLLTMIANV